MRRNRKRADIITVLASCLPACIQRLDQFLLKVCLEFLTFEPRRPWLNLVLPLDRKEIRLQKKKKKTRRLPCYPCWRKATSVERNPSNHVCKLINSLEWSQEQPSESGAVLAGKKEGLIRNSVYQAHGSKDSPTLELLACTMFTSTKDQRVLKECVFSLPNYFVQNVPWGYCLLLQLLTMFTREISPFWDTNLRSTKSRFWFYQYYVKKGTFLFVGKNPTPNCVSATNKIDKFHTTLH